MTSALRTTGLLSLSAMPILAGIARLYDQTRSTPTMDASMGSTHMPSLLLVHIAGASIFLILGAFQFMPVTRVRAWHRQAGRVAVIAGLLGAGSGAVLTVALPMDPTAGPLLVPMRFFFSLLWFAALALGLILAVRRQINAHRAWIIRGYTVGVATGLQSLILLPWFFLFGVPTGLPSDLVMLAGWIVALLVGERMIRQRHNAFAPLARIPNPR